MQPLVMHVGESVQSYSLKHDFDFILSVGTVVGAFCNFFFKMENT